MAQQAAYPAVRRTSGPIQRFFTTPKGTVLVVLLALMLIASANHTDAAGIHNVLIAALTGMLFDVFVGLMRGNRRWWLGDGGAITGIIVGLVLGSTTPWYITVLTAAVAMMSKHVLKIGRKPIFNPAAFGLLVAVYVFHTGQSWWGDLADLPGWCVIFLIAAGYFITSRVNKFPQVLTFLGVSFGLCLLAGYYHVGQAAFSPGDALRMPLVNSTLFLAFFMLTDPPTSAGRYRDQVVFGMITAAVSVLVYLKFGGLTYLLIGLLVANVWRAWSAKRTESARRGMQQNVARSAS